MVTIPREPGFDSSLALLRYGFAFIQKRCRRHGTDLFRTRIMWQNTICLTGEDAARLFCDPEKFRRRSSRYNESGTYGFRWFVFCWFVFQVYVFRCFSLGSSTKPEERKHVKTEYAGT